MKFRKLQVVWSVWWGVAAVLLCVLWMRSFHTNTHDIISGKITGTQSVAVLSEWGKVSLGVYNTQDYVTGPYQLFHADDGSWAGGGTYGRFYFGTTANSAKVLLPHYFLMLVTGIAAALPWLVRRWRWRFSLRTLLIATTLVAVVLGLVVWASR
jgi:hypothetical protein